MEKKPHLGFAVLLILSACGEGAVEAPETTAGIPFDNNKNQIILEVYLGEKGPYNMLLDTGVDPSVVDIDVAREAGLPIDLGDENQAAGVGSDRVAIYPSELQAITLGGEAYGNALAAAMDMGQLEERLGKPLHGVLGFSFFTGKIVEIHYPNQTVSVTTDDVRAVCAEDEADTCFSFPLEPTTDGFNSPKIHGLRIDGVEVIASMDTGSSGGFDVNAETLSAMGIGFSVDPEKTTTVVGARGEAERTEGIVRNVTLGPFSLGDVEAHFETERFGEGYFRHTNVGNIVFQGFILTLDYKNYRIAFRKKD